MRLLPDDAYAQVVEALEETKRGLEWYQDYHPGCVDGSDDEAMERTDAALALLRSMEPVEPDAEVIEHVRNTHYKIRSRWHLPEGTLLYAAKGTTE